MGQIAANPRADIKPADAGALKSALDAKDRTACGPVAPPDGLYLMRVDY